MIGLILIIAGLYWYGAVDQLARGKYVNLVLSLGLLVGLAIIFRKYFSWLHSLNLLLIVAFTVFILKAGYFQTELLFFTS